MELPSIYRIIFRAIRPLNDGKQAKYCPSLVWISLFSFSTLCHAGQYSPLQLKQDVLSFLTKEYHSVASDQVEISVGNLDRRLRLYKCPSALRMEAQDNSGLGGNISVLASCNAKPGWSVYVPAQVYIYRQIPVAKHDLLRGQLITSTDITSESINISLIRQEFADKSQAALGQEVKRSIYRGDPLKTANLQPPTSIKRGENVAILASAGAIKVNSAGVALSDGRLGEKIRVRNNQSKRIISGLVVAPGEVRIN